MEVSFSFIRDRIHCVLNARTPLLHIAVAWHVDRRAVEKDGAGEGQRDHHAVPGVQQLFFLAAKAMGTIGNPVACAA
jgi:hypothetical protein